MRLVSCIGLLTVIPAIALLTHSNEPHAAIETHQQDKMSAAISANAVQTDSLLRAKVNTPAQKHLGFTVKSAVETSSVLTKQ
ncbi:hypothetical protein [Pedobacter miscanthi]|uniref:Uncharacterized protein n=1 Tax=Pedobacter miscanthi TaxID=2259170 RepID=A0A366L114_9SPHI|nr:hypothetical protein [Pedobacter miscanthi]RBQ07575.1 hypothetical protein DRW42_10320 [Pedobacter miscanthi]